MNIFYENALDFFDDKVIKEMTVSYIPFVNGNRFTSEELDYLASVSTKEDFNFYFPLFHRNTSPETLVKLYEKSDGSFMINFLIAANAKTPLLVLKKILEEDYEQYEQIVINNPIYRNNLKK